MKRSAVVYSPSGDILTYETGKEYAYSMESFSSRSIIKDISTSYDNALFIYFENDAILSFYSVPFEYFQMPEEAE